MAASKRFLGLGFTFAATDKGLEKKLKAVSENLSTISDQLEGLDKLSKKAQTGLQSLADLKLNEIHPKLEMPKDLSKMTKHTEFKSKDPKTGKYEMKKVKQARPPGDDDYDVLEEMFNRDTPEQKIEPKILTKEGKDYGIFSGSVEQFSSSITEMTKSLNSIADAVKGGSRDDSALSKSISKLIQTTASLAMPITKSGDLIVKKLDYWMKHVLAAFKKMNESFKKGFQPTQKITETLKGFLKRKHGPLKSEKTEMEKFFEDKKKTEQKSAGTLNIDEIMNTLNPVSAESKKTLNDMIGSVKEILSPKEFDHFYKNIKSMSLNVDKSGNILSSDFDRLAKTSAKFIVESDKAQKQMKSLKIAFMSMWEYLKDVGGAFENFLDSIGINLRRMIPPQVSAAFGVLATAVKPLVGGLKSILFGSSEDTQKDSNEKLREIADELLGRNTSPNGLVENIKKILNKKSDKKDGIFGGLFDHLKGLLYSLPLIGPLFQVLGRAMNLLMMPLRWVWRGLTSLGGVITRLFGPFNKLTDFMPKSITQFGRMFFVVGVAVSAIWGFVEGVMKSKDEWIKVWDNLVITFNKLTAYLGNVLAPIGAMIDEAAAWIGDKFSSITDTLFDVIKSSVTAAFGDTGGMVVDLIKDIFNGVAEFIGEFLKKIVKLDLIGAGKMFFGSVKDGWKAIGENAPKLINAGLETINESIPDVEQPKPLDLGQTTQSTEPIRSEAPKKELMSSAASFDTSQLVSSNKVIASKFDQLILLQAKQIDIMSRQAQKPVNVNMQVKTDGAAVVNQVKRNEERQLVGAGIGH